MVSEGKTLLFCGTNPTPISTSVLARRLVMSWVPRWTLPERTLHQAEHRLQQRRLAGAVRADDADHLARVGDQAAAVEDVDAGQVAGDEVLGLDHRGLLLGVGRHGRLLLALGLLLGDFLLELLESRVGEEGVVAQVGVVVRAQVGVDDRLVGHHRVGPALGDQPPLGHHHDPVGDVAHDVHVVLDEQHGRALVAKGLDVPEERLGERRVHARHRLVEHDHLRVAHQGPSHLEQLALASGERPGVVLELLVQAEPLEQLQGLGLDLLLLRAPERLEEGLGEVLAGLVLGAQHHVVHHRHPAQRLGELEGADHAGLRDPGRRGPVEGGTVEAPVRRLPGRRAVEPGDQVEERRLAGAVGSDQRGDDAALHLEVLDVDGGDAAEVPGDVVDPEDGVGLRRAGLRVDAGHQLAPGGRVGQPAGGRGLRH